MKELLQHIPDDLTNFLLVGTFSLLIGLEQRVRHPNDKEELAFGTDRTFTLIGILGFILYRITPGSWVLFIGGGLLLGAFLAVFYYGKIQHSGKFGLTSIMTALITYCLAPILYTQPDWLVLLIVVAVLILVEIKENLIAFSQKFTDDEFITLAKFLLLAGVILPLLPHEQMADYFPVSPYRIWLAIVVVSAISYISYLLQKFIFPKAGLLLTSILGGLYSSTATTVILARKSKEIDQVEKTAAGIVLATLMMFVRIFVLALIFDKEVALSLIPFFAMLILVAGVISGLLYYRGWKLAGKSKKTKMELPQNPLEFKTALLFGILFLFFALLTHWVMQQYGGSGVKYLSFVVGVTDIDPFIINLLQGNTTYTASLVTLAIVNATTSNNLLKMAYAMFLGERKMWKYLWIGFIPLIITGLLLVWVIA